MEDNSPLRVYYPDGGHRFMLHWWTYNDRGHLILASSLSNLETIARRIFEEHPDAEIKNFSEIEIVAPSNLLSKLANLYDQKDRIDTFHRMVVHDLKQALEAGRTLPSLFRICDEFHSSMEEDPDSADPDSDQYARDTHMYCDNCCDTIQLVGITPTELYQRYHASYEEINPQDQYLDPKLVVSRAPQASDHEPLWYASSMTGHHSSGTDLKEVDMQEIERANQNIDQVYRPDCIGNHTLFFYRHKKDLDSSDLQFILDDFKSNQENNRKARKAKIIADFVQEQNNRMDRTMSIFNG